jgi:hypothetical protein
MLKPEIVPDQISCNSSRSNLNIDDHIDRTFEVDKNYRIPFTSNQLLSHLKDFVSSVNQIPIEKYEIDLYQITKKFSKRMGGKEVDILCVGRIHHIIKVMESKTEVPDIPKSKIEAKISSLITHHPLVMCQYELFKKMIKIWNGLLVKWKIFSLKLYDYRHSGRTLNVRMLDLPDINSGLLNIDVLWISSKIFTSPMNVIASPYLLEQAVILHDQLSRSFRIFFSLNSKQFDESYNIEKTVAFTSQKFWKWSPEECPEQSLSNYKHFELKYVSGIAKCFKSNNPKIEQAYGTLVDLEIAYRTFEKTLIASILENIGKAEF